MSVHTYSSMVTHCAENLIHTLLHLLHTSYLSSEVPPVTFAAPQLVSIMPI